MIVSKRQYKSDTEALLAQLCIKDAEIEQLEKRVKSVEESQHGFVEAFRHVLEAGSLHIADPHREHLKTLGHVLPYLLSERRHWNDDVDTQLVQSARERAEQLARSYGFSLPRDNPIEAVTAMLDLAVMLFNPMQSLPLEGLRNRYRLEGN